MKPHRRIFAQIVLILIVLPARAGADWAFQGTPLTTAPRAKTALALVSDGAGGAFAAWTDERALPSRDIFLQHVGGSGIRAAGWQPNGDSVTTLPCHRDTIAMAPDGAGGVLLAWTENRCANWNTIYALRLTASGAL